MTSPTGPPPPAQPPPDQPPRGGQVTLRSLVLPAYLPATLFSIGQGAIAPVVVLSATGLGAGPAAAALVVAMAGVGQLIADIPAGALAARFGDRTAMVGAAVLTCIALIGCIWAPNLAVFTAAIFGTGMGTAVWLLARQAYITQAVPFALRARAMSTLGGVYRIGLFLGPFIGGFVVLHTSLVGAYAVQLVSCVLAVAVLLTVPDLAHARSAGSAAPVSTWGLAREYRSVFGTVGVGVLLVSAVRASRQAVIPLWGQHLGLDAPTIAVVFGVSGAVDMLLFYPAGQVMDRYGRAAAAVPSMLILALGHLLLPLTHSVGTLLAVGIMLGIGNGASSGLVMTLGADLAPPGARPRFLGIWRLLADVGNSAGPLALSAVTAAASLGAGITAVGGVGAATALLMGRWIARRAPLRSADRQSPHLPD